MPTVTQRATKRGDGTQRALFGASGQPVAVANPATVPSGMACAIAVRVARGVVVREVARGMPFGEVLHEQVAPSIGGLGQWLKHRQGCCKFGWLLWQVSQQRGELHLAV